MAKAKKKPKWRYRAAKRFRRRLPKRFSILTGVGMAAGAMISLNDRTAMAPSIMEAIKNPSWGWDNALCDTLVQTIGIDPRDGQTGCWKFRVPTFTALTLIGAVGSKIVGHFVKPKTFDVIPYFGKKIKL